MGSTAENLRPFEKFTAPEAEVRSKAANEKFATRLTSSDYQNMYITFMPIKF